MKTTLNLLLLVLAIALPLVTFAGLVELLPLTAFVASEATFCAFSFVGLMLVALNDDGKGRRPLIVRPSILPAQPATTGAQTAYGPSYGLRRRVCTIA
jgi:hypothetical protein